MKTRFLILLLLLAVALLGVIASGAGAAAPGLPQVGTPDVAHLNPFRGSWWSGSNGYGSSVGHPPGTPIPAQDYVVVYFLIIDPEKSVIMEDPQIDLFSLTIKASQGVIVVETTEEQSAGFFSGVYWDPMLNAWCRAWKLPLGYLPVGSYEVTMVEHSIASGWFSVLDENGNWTGPFFFKPYKDQVKTSFTVQ